MNTKHLLGGLATAILLASCDNSPIYGSNTATVAASVTPWGGVYDSMVIDVRRGGFRGPLRETNRDPMADPDQSLIYIDDLPQGDWVFAAVYYKTNKDGSTSHRVAVAQGTVEAVYHQDCDCRELEGDDVDLRLAD